MPGTILGICNIPWSKTDEDSCPHRVYVPEIFSKLTALVYAEGKGQDGIKILA